MKPTRPILLLALTALLCHCAEENTEDFADESDTIIIVTPDTLATPALSVPAQTTISILNRDESPHTITSQSAVDAFDNTGVFDVMIPAGGVGNFTLPDAPSGTQFFFYCRFHTETMAPASGTITIE